MGTRRMRNVLVAALLGAFAFVSPDEARADGCWTAERVELSCGEGGDPWQGSGNCLTCRNGCGGFTVVCDSGAIVCCG